MFAHALAFWEPVVVVVVVPEAVLVEVVVDVPEAVLVVVDDVVDDEVAGVVLDDVVVESSESKRHCE